MSRTIDEKVVEMRFDNKNFEKNVSTSLSTIDKLKQSLNLTGATKGLENVDSAAKGVNMSPLSGAVDTVRAKFSALEVMAVTALANITNSAVNTGKRMISALTIEPIKAGFQEYETQMNAVQTILANTQKEGANVETVNKALDELNAYADKTIYNFTEMTRNIGTFTAAGVKLDTSVSSIKGIANLAAVSGSSSQQASTAMYQLSQAIASGTVKLMDWNSVVNAGMGGQVFQDALIRTAEHLGTGAKAAIAAKGSFRESLQTGWLTTEVLTQTLDQFATAADTEKEYEAAVQKFVSQGYSQEQARQMADMARTAGDAATKVKTFTQLIDTLKEALGSGWTASWRIIVGDFEEAKELWTEVSDYFSEAINKSAEARNSMLEGWKEGGGRTMVIEAVKNAFEGLVNIIKPVKEAFREVFPRTTSEQLIKFSDGLRKLTARFKELTEKHAPKLKSTFKGIFAIVDIGVTFIKEIISGIAKLLGNFTRLGDGVLGATGSIGDWISKLRDSIKESGVFGLVIGKVVGFLQKAIDKIKEFSSYLKKKFLAPGFEGFLKVITGIWNVLKAIGGKIAEVASKIGSAINNAFRSGDIKSGLDLLNGGIFATVLLKIGKFVKGISDVFENADGFLKGITETLDAVRGCFEQYQKNLKADMLKKISVAIAILAAALFVIATIDSDKLNSSLLAIGALFGELLIAMKIFDKIGGKYKNAGKAATLMIGMSLAVLILAGSLKQLANLDWEEIGKSLTGILGLTAIVIGAMALLSKFVASSEKIFGISKDGIFSSKTKTNFISMGLAMIAIAASMKIFASAAKDLATLDWEGLAKGLTGIGVILLEVVGFFALMKSIKPEKIISTSLAIIAIATSMKIFSSAAKDFAEMDWDSIAKAGASIGGILLAVAAFARIIGSSSSVFVASKYGIFSQKTSKNLLSMSVSLIAIAGAMKIFASAAKDFASFSWNELAKAGAAIGGILLAIAGFVNAIPPSAKLIKMGVSLVMMAASMKVFASAAKSFADMNWNELAKAGAAIGGILLAVGMFATIIGSSSSVFVASKYGIFSQKTSKNLLSMSVSLIAVAVAMKIFASSMKDISALSWGDIAKGLLTFAGVFVVFGAAAAILRPVIPAMYALSGAIALFGVGCALAGAGVLALSIGLTALGASIIVASNSIIEVVKALVNGIGDIIVSFCKGIANSALAIAEAFVAVIEAACFALIESAPLIAETFLKLLVEGLTLLKDYVPQIVNLLVDVFIDLFDSLGARLPELSPAIASFVEKLIDSMKDAFGDGVGEKILGALETVSKALLEIAIAAKVVSSINIAGAVQGVAGLAIFVGGLAAILAILGGLNQIPGFDWLLGEGVKVLGILGSAIGTFIGNLVGSFSAGVTSGLPQIGQNLSDFMTNIKGFVDGAKSIDSSVVSGIANLAKAALVISEVDMFSKIASWITGGSSIVSFGKQLSEFGPYFKAYADSIVGIDSSAVTASATAAKALAEMANVVPNEGGMVAWFTGENSIANFGDELVTFGVSLKRYSDSVAGIDPAIVTASAKAAKALAEMANTIPNEGGMAAWFTGDNSLANFGDELVTFGVSLKSYSDSVAGIDPAVVTASATAAKALSDLANTIPNEGGMAAWFAGDNSLASFGSGIVAFGQSLKDYATSVAGIDPAVVTASATAGKALAEMANTIPNEGGMAAWFAGDNSLASFSDGIIAFGVAIKSFSDSVAGINVESVNAAATAGKALAEMASTIPNEGGVAAWFAGENSLASFSDGIVDFGTAIKSFSESVAGIDAESVTSAATAGKTLAQMVDTIPNEGGIAAWFGGDNSLASFSDGIVDFGTAIKSFSESVTGIDTEAVIAAATAGKTLAQMVDTIPNEGGMVAWFSGENSLASFSDGIVDFGDAIHKFSNKVTGIDTEAVTAAATAGKTLAQMTSTIPKSGGIAAWFGGENSMASFSEGIVAFGGAISEFSGKVTGIQVEEVQAAATAGKTLAQMADTIPKSGKDLTSFGDQVKQFGTKLKDFASEIAGIKTSELTNQIDNIKTAMKTMADVAKKGVDDFSKAFGDGKSEVASSVTDLIKSIASAVDSKKESVTKSFKSIAEQALNAVKNFGLYSNFYNLGINLVNGFANGITANTFKARARARAMAKSAYDAAKSQLGIHSPSKVFRKLGTYVPEGFAIGIDKFGSLVKGSAVGMADTAINGTRDAIARISDVINSDVDAQPTIRPVLDLSEVKAGAGAINSMIGGTASIGVMSNINAISTMMNRSQNGSNSDVISAIKDLGRTLGNTSGNTYTINGITYDDGSNVSEAIRTLVRAAKVERRT